MRPQGTGIVELHDTKQNERGFFCMELVEFLTEDGRTEWDEWHGAFMQAAAGQCPYTEKCPRYARSIEKQKQNQQKKAIQYTFNF